jgi:predicted nuclease of predicted toxin-antitoxin system
MHKFKVDENLPIEVAELLAGAGHDALTVHDQQMVGEPDTRLSQVCQREDRAIITLDLDFADIRTYPPADYAGIVALRPARLDKPHVLSIIQRLLPILEDEPLSATLWIVDESSVRVRG